MLLQSLLESWFSRDPECVADEGVYEFLVNFLEDDSLDEEPEQLELYLACYSTRFAALSEEDKSDEVADILRAAGSLRSRHRASAPSSSAGPKPATSDDLSAALARLDLSSAALTAQARELASLLGLESIAPALASVDAPAPCLPYLVHVLRDRFQGSAERAAPWCLDQGVEQLGRLDLAWRRGVVEAHRAEAIERRAAAAAKKQVVDRFLFSEIKQGAAPAVPSGPVLRPLEESNSKVRFHDGKVVSTKGEKYVVEKLTEDWDGGSRGRIKSKRKGGKGFY